MESSSEAATKAGQLAGEKATKLEQELAELRQRYNAVKRENECLQAESKQAVMDIRAKFTAEQQQLLKQVEAKVRGEIVSARNQIQEHLQAREEKERTMRSEMKEMCKMLIGQDLEHGEDHALQSLVQRAHRTLVDKTTRLEEVESQKMHLQEVIELHRKCFETASRKSSSEAHDQLLFQEQVRSKLNLWKLNCEQVTKLRNIIQKHVKETVAGLDRSEGALPKCAKQARSKHTSGESKTKGNS